MENGSRVLCSLKMQMMSFFVDHCETQKQSNIGICVKDGISGPDSHFINEGEIMQWKDLLR